MGKVKTFGDLEKQAKYIKNCELFAGCWGDVVRLSDVKAFLKGKVLVEKQQLEADKKRCQQVEKGTETEVWREGARWRIALIDELLIGKQVFDETFAEKSILSNQRKRVDKIEE